MLQLQLQQGRAQYQMSLLQYMAKVRLSFAATYSETLTKCTAPVPFVVSERQSLEKKIPKPFLKIIKKGIFCQKLHFFLSKMPKEVKKLFIGFSSLVTNNMGAHERSKMFGRNRHYILGHFLSFFFGRLCQATLIF